MDGMDYGKSDSGIGANSKQEYCTTRSSPSTWGAYNKKQNDKFNWEVGRKGMGHGKSVSGTGVVAIKRILHGIIDIHPQQSDITKNKMATQLGSRMEWNGSWEVGVWSWKSGLT